MTQEAILSVKNISKCFGDLEVLKGISFDIHKGEKIAILGPSGSGNPRSCAASISWRPTTGVKSIIWENR